MVKVFYCAYFTILKKYIPFEKYNGIKHFHFMR